MEWATERSRERFWAKVELAAAAECWVWQGSLRAPQNYGTYNNQLAHRLAYADVKGPIPEGSVIRHGCDVPYCVNPNHLLLGTQGDNMQDKVDRGRARGGPVQHKLNKEQVFAIQQAAKAGLSQRALAREYKVSQPLISYIVNHKTRLRSRLRSGKRHYVNSKRKH